MLTDIAIRKAKPRDAMYRIADGAGLCLEVQPHGSKLWRFRYRYGGKAKMLSMGAYPEVGLSEARERTEKARRIIAEGGDPSQERKAAKSERLHTFGEVCAEWHALASRRLDPDNAQATLGRLEKDILPWLGSRPITEIKPPELLACLRRVEGRGAVETASRLLGWCGQVFRHAVACGIMESDPTRDLRGALARPEEGHFAALTNPDEIAGLLRAVDGYHGDPITRAALIFGILTFVRPGNLREAEWGELHGLGSDSPEWRIPGEKMKIRTARPFVVPLAPWALRVLEGLRPLTGESRFIFPSPRSFSRPLSNNAVNAALRRMGFTKDEMTGHGVRAMARTVCHEVLGFAPEVIEEQLAHGKGGPLRDAYDRTTHMEERRRLMATWAEWLEGIKDGATK